MSSLECCEEIVEPTFLGWSSISYLLLPLNIAFYDLGQLYISNCNCFKYHAPFINSFQTGVYSYILCVLFMIHTLSLFSCHGCSDCIQSLIMLVPIDITYTNYICDIPKLTLHCIYAMLAMFSWTRCLCQFGIKRYYTLLLSTTSEPSSTHIKALKKAKLSHKMLFKTTSHWIFTLITLSIVISLDIIAYILLAPWAQLLISISIYGFSYFTFILCESLIRDLFTKQSSINDPVRVLGLFEVKTHNKKAVFALILTMIAGCGYFIDYLHIINDISFIDINLDEMYIDIGHGVFNIFTSLSITIWYWALVGEDWIFKTPSDIIQLSYLSMDEENQDNIRVSHSSDDTKHSNDSLDDNYKYGNALVELAPLQEDYSLNEY